MYMNGGGKELWPAKGMLTQLLSQAQVHPWLGIFVLNDSSGLGILLTRLPGPEERQRGWAARRWGLQAPSRFTVSGLFAMGKDHIWRSLCVYWMLCSVSACLGHGAACGVLCFPWGLEQGNASEVPSLISAFIKYGSAQR